jgi:hypothetical protein
VCMCVCVWVCVTVVVVLALNLLSSAATLMGLANEDVIRIPSDLYGRMQPGALREYLSRTDVG